MEVSDNLCDLTSLLNGGWKLFFGGVPPFMERISAYFHKFLKLFLGDSVEVGGVHCRVRGSAHRPRLYLLNFFFFLSACVTFWSTKGVIRGGFGRLVNETGPFCAEWRGGQWKNLLSEHPGSWCKPNRK